MTGDPAPGRVEHPAAALDTVCIEAAGVPIGIPAAAHADYAGFAPSSERPAVVLDEPDPVLLTGDVVRAAVERSELLCLHAAVVHGTAGAIVVPGASGLGKSTLAAALTLAGFGYLSDEALVLDAGECVAFPRPPTLDARARRLLGLEVPADEPDDVERLVPLTLLGRPGPRRCAPATVLLAERRAAPLKIRPERRGAAVAALIAASFNHYRLPRGHLAAIVELVRASDVFRVTYSDARLLADELRRMEL